MNNHVRNALLIEKETEQGKKQKTHTHNSLNDLEKYVHYILAIHNMIICFQVFVRNVFVITCFNFILYACMFTCQNTPFLYVGKVENNVWEIVLKTFN